MARAMTVTYPLDAGRVLKVAEQAAAELGPYDGPAAAQLSGLAARAHAALGHDRSARSRLRATERIAGRLTAEQAGETFFGFPRREMVMYTSQVLTAAGDPAAWHAQADALAGYPASDRMDRPLILLGRARHLARYGEPEQAAHVATNAIGAIALPFRVPLLMSEARAVGQAITAASARAGRQYAQFLHEAVPAPA